MLQTARELKKNEGSLPVAKGRTFYSSEKRIINLSCGHVCLSLIIKPSVNYDTRILSHITQHRQNHRTAQKAQHISDNKGVPVRQKNPIHRHAVFFKTQYVITDVSLRPNANVIT
jgi:hypothetical protein